MMSEENLSLLRGQISSGRYSLADMQNRINALYIAGQLTDVQYSQMMADAAANVDASYADTLDVSARLDIAEAAIADLIDIVLGGVS